VGCPKVAKRDYPEKELSALLSDFRATLKGYHEALSRLSEALAVMESNNDREAKVKEGKIALDVLYDLCEYLFKFEIAAENAAGFTKNDDEEKKAWGFIRAIKSHRESIESLQKTIKNYLKVLENPDLIQLAKEELKIEFEKFKSSIAKIEESESTFLTLIQEKYEKARLGRPL